MLRSVHRRLLAVTVAVSGSVFLAGPAAAAPAPAVGLRAIGHWPHGYYIYQARPGTVLHGAIAVVNTGRAGGQVRMYPADSTTGQTSGAVYLTSTTSPHQTGRWIALATTTTQLAAGGQKRIAFTVTVPAGASPGPHLAGIVAEPVQEQLSSRSNGKASVQIKFRSLAIVAVEIDVPGPLHAQLTVGAIKPGGRKGTQQLLVHLANTGNVMLKPAGTLAIRDTTGHVVKRFPLRLDTFLPHTAIDYPVTVNGHGLPAGEYTTTISLAYRGLSGGGNGTATAAPPLTISATNETQIYGQTTPPTGASPSAANSTHTTSANGFSPLLWAAIAAGALALLAGVYLLGRRRH
jgi:hypothetical protein